MSNQEHCQDIATGMHAVRFSLATMPKAVDFLPEGSETRFVAANGNQNWAHRHTKRIFDLALAIPALIAVAPLLALLAVLIRLDSDGPALFRQKRCGFRGRPFDILKFRTMRVQENGDAIVQAARSDARTTRIGRWLRTSSLDELPQLINIIKGDMSLVGPRPHARAHDALYGELIAHYQRRQSVKPGLTGWAQIHGLRGATPTVDLMSRRVDHDVWYAQNASFALDVKILLRTPLEVVRRRNAY